MEVFIFDGGVEAENNKDSGIKTIKWENCSVKVFYKPDQNEFGRDGEIRGNIAKLVFTGGHGFKSVYKSKTEFKVRKNHSADGDGSGNNKYPNMFFGGFDFEKEKAKNDRNN